MEAIELKARAKINLTLDILGKRPDGFHEVEMVMQTVELHDQLSLEEIPEGILISCEHPQVPLGETNIAYKAARLIIEQYGINRGVRITINKNIPIAAGLAGGSADAAAVLEGLNRMWDLGQSTGQLEALGALIGSDVPFCQRGGTALAQGRGELLTSLPDAPDMWIILAKPQLEVSTALVYRNYDPTRVTRKPCTPAMLDALRAGDRAAVLANLANVLESVTLEMFPDVAGIKAVIADAGVLGALMSGSGPTVFGVVRSRQEGAEICQALRARLPGVYIELTKTWPG